MYYTKHAFNIENKRVDLISIENQNNMKVNLLNYGATIVEIFVPDKQGKCENIILTYKDIQDYIQNKAYFGATIGRTAGRIGKGEFILDKKIYKLSKNYGMNQGHGGEYGFSFRIWDYKIKETENTTSVEFAYLSKDMEEGYPGNLQVKVIYTLTEDNQLMIEYRGKSDKKTLCNLTNHSYFNLSGKYKRKITKQYLKIKANDFLELDENQIPTGKWMNVKNTPMDFLEFKRIGKDIKKSYEQLVKTKGYDHTWILNGKENQIEMYDEISGRKMSITTTYPSVVIYSYNFPSNEKLKYDKVGASYDGICFETQYEPDGIHHENLNKAILDVGENYDEKTKFKFSII